MPTAVRWTDRQLALFEAGGKPRRARRPAPALERRTHIAIADLLRQLGKPGWFWWHTPSGELRTKATASLLKRMGVKPGIPDFALLGPGERDIRFLELKRGKLGKLSPDQLEFAGMCRERAIPHAICRGFAEAEAQLRAWDVLRPEARRNDG